ncbi:pyridoxine 5'-phosphate synthase [Alphaproteobacteria bacterium GH1-50]|uniref:Pyridoxine 5'-phosphate synthase n=1 Tax=Kangsaoukella pontilimi TaxID=2691042 RepID=A0A7C9MCW4_9RHOB|nr:pyridoxine 5'-phosphate synthase [Kangsaoukella pontilimi]MXQ07851.1 pyridoxine 5'-phosphate synthase [Kangsaoukella pontilimi]
MPTKLSVNLNAVAFLRNRRTVPWPDLATVARAVLDAGAHGITVHPRPDERHIRFADVAVLSELMAAEYPEAEFNIEGYPSRQFLDLVASSAAHQVTLVPDDPEQSTSDHGWDFAAHGEMLRGVTEELRQGGRRVSLFLDAAPDAPAAAVRAGADRIELFTGPYGAALAPDDAQREIDRLVAAADAARSVGGERPFGMNAGHDLTAENLPALCAAIPDLAEVSIGHGLTADALLLGFPAAVRRYLQVLGH